MQTVRPQRQRLTDTHQQLIFFDENGRISQGVLACQDFEPQLIDRVIFRDPMGQLVMDAKLSKYKNDRRQAGHLIPHRFEVQLARHRRLHAADRHVRLEDAAECQQADHPAFQFPA